ncbi:hypothetical protein SAMN04487968_102223 [Nocardioides terrae]|uniref:DUF559 domain-containing protein n=1 Tax=Nocardioides terrae TaxID=574651 RepID=A0A1I1EU55_9ACTN|nr:hypothetical protein [Nocardioides terrae]SFB90212.1 hypothetical protein SAMN04487968_102223 [Nocardioides terrae]
MDYPELGLAFELDGRLGHDGSAARDRDLERDLDAAVDAGRTTIRIGWGQVFDRPCSTAAELGRLLQQRGWPERSAGARVAPDRGHDPQT